MGTRISNGLLLQSTGQRHNKGVLDSYRGVTLIELLVVVLLIPLLGLTIVQLDMFVQNYFTRTSRSMISEQEVEIALGAIAQDILIAQSITVYNGGWALADQVALGTAGDRLELIIDDDHDIPPDPTNDDGIRYWYDGATRTIIRSYAVDRGSGGSFDVGQIIARNIDLLELTQTVRQPPSVENLPAPQNVIRARVRALFGQTAVERIRYITSRALRAIP